MSILSDIKAQIPGDSFYDNDLIIQINTAFSTLTHLGVGPDEGFFITGDTEDWDDFITDSDQLKKIQMVKQYVFLKTKVIFDPPSNSYVMTAYNEQIDELEWRLNDICDKGE